MRRKVSFDVAGREVVTDILEGSLMDSGPVEFGRDELTHETMFSRDPKRLSAAAT